MTVPSGKFREQMETCAKRSTLGFRDFINVTMLKIVTTSYKLTRVADRAKIERRLGITAYKTSISKKTGKYVRRKAVITGLEETVAYRIVQKRAQEAGAPLTTKQADTAARRMIGAILRSVGFIRSGWIPAIQKLSRIVPARDRTDGGAKRSEVKGRPKGYVIPMGAPAPRMICEAGNTTKVAADITGPAVAQAMQQVQGWLEKKLKEYMEREIGAAIGGKTVK